MGKNMTNRFTDSGEGVSYPLCNKCSRRITATKCKAYKKRIPDAIIKGGKCVYFNEK